MSATYLALLRGVNVGGNNKLPMKDLIRVFVETGCNDVRTYIQSGNVMFSTDPDALAGLPGLITTRIASRFGIRTPVVLRTSEQIAGVVANNPFLLEGAEDARLYVMFLADHPSPGRVDGLDPDRSPPDRFIVRGQEVYLRIPNGAATTKLTNSYFDSKLSTTSTVRNWRTVTTLLELMNQSG
jgi:uncharacterized protein (DUF1697 family)